MTIQLVPTFNVPFFTQTTVLEGVNYLFSFAYAQRESSWYMSLADANGVDIYNGVKLVCINMLMKKCKDPRKPPGDFMVLSGTTDLSPPGLNDLVANTGRCQLFYATGDILSMILNGTIDTYLNALATNTALGTASSYGLQ